MKCKMRKLTALLLAVAFCLSTQVPALAANQSRVSVQTFSDGAKLETYVTGETTKEFIEYDASNEVVNKTTFEEKDDVNIATLDNGEEVFKSVFNPETKAVKIYTKPSGSPDSEYVLYYESPEPSISIIPRKGLTDYRHGSYFEFDWYEYDDNSHDLFIDHKVAKAPANKFLSECDSFLKNSTAADDNTRLIILDLFGLVPEFSVATTVAHITYTRSITGDTSAAIADALASYAISVAGKVCSPAKAIAAFIDGVNLIMCFNKVQDAYNAVKNG